jgi:hypothetical protein
VLESASVAFAVQFRRGGTDETPTFSLGGDEWRQLLIVALHHNWRPKGAFTLRPPQAQRDAGGNVTVHTPVGGFVSAGSLHGGIAPRILSYLATPCRIEAGDALALAAALIASGSLDTRWTAATLRNVSADGIDVL